MKRSSWIVVIVAGVAVAVVWGLFMFERKPRPRAEVVNDDKQEVAAPDPGQAAPMPTRRQRRLAVPAPKPAPRPTPAPAADDPTPAAGKPEIKLPPEVIERNKKLMAAAMKKQRALLEQSVKVAHERVETLGKDLSRLRRDPNVTAEQMRMIERQIEQYRAAEIRIQRQLQDQDRAKQNQPQ